jgi:hypothetical protein
MRLIIVIAIVLLILVAYKANKIVNQYRIEQLRTVYKLTDDASIDAKITELELEVEKTRSNSNLSSLPWYNKLEELKKIINQLKSLKTNKQ